MRKKKKNNNKNTDENYKYLAAKNKWSDSFPLSVPHLSAVAACQQFPGRKFFFLLLKNIEISFLH